MSGNIFPVGKPLPVPPKRPSISKSLPEKPDSQFKTVSCNWNSSRSRRPSENALAIGTSRFQTYKLPPAPSPPSSGDESSVSGDSDDPIFTLNDNKEINCDLDKETAAIEELIITNVQETQESWHNENDINPKIKNENYDTNNNILKRKSKMIGNVEIFIPEPDFSNFAAPPSPQAKEFVLPEEISPHDSESEESESEEELPPAYSEISSDECINNLLDEDEIETDSDGDDEDEENDDFMTMIELAVQQDEDEEEGAQTFEECKMIIKWEDDEEEQEETKENQSFSITQKLEEETQIIEGNLQITEENMQLANLPPPVPSRDDPSHKLSDQEALQFIQQKELVPTAYEIISTDPRFIRIRSKWCTNLLTVQGRRQFLKNQVDVTTIPYLGLLFHANRVKNCGKNLNKIQKLQKNAPDELKESLKTMKGGQVAHSLQETAYTGVAAACLCLPMTNFVPGLGPQLMILGKVGAAAAEATFEMGLKVVISQTARLVPETMSKSTTAFDGFGSSKAFLLYLGLPKSDDPLYAEWESSRLKLKALYGCEADDDLRKMRPSGRLLNQIREDERKLGKPYKIEIPLLLLLWRAFECWDEKYWDRMVHMKEKTKGKTRKALGLRRDLTLDEKRRMRDYRYLQEQAAVIESEKPLDPHLRIIRKHQKKQVIHLLTESFLHSNHVHYLFTRKKTRLDQKKKLKWFMSMVVDYFFAHGDFFWGYMGTDNSLKAIAIWEPPNEKAKISFLSLLRTSGAFKLGAHRWKLMSDILFHMEEMRQSDVRGIRCWHLQWIAVDPRYQKQGLARLLVENTIRRHSEPVYVQLFDMEEEASLFFKKLCFFPIRKEIASSNFTMHGKQVEIHAFWHGIHSPTELRALMPAKKSSFDNLQLTYKSIRSAPQVFERARSALAIEFNNHNHQKSPVLCIEGTEEHKHFKEAKTRYEETAILLGHLKMSLSLLSIEERESSAGQDFLMKIAECKYLLETYQTSLNDSEANMNARIAKTSNV